jgi:hypothetical protein
MIEAPIEDWACDEAEKAGWLVRKLKWVGRRSGCDRFFAKDGRVLLIEFKRPGGKPNPGQEREIARLQAAGVEVHVVDNPLAALRILEVVYAPV